MTMNEKGLRLKGHRLEAEGAPHGGNGRQTGAFLSVGGWGRGKCSCGALSDELDSASKRKQWHREHKAQIRAVSS